MLRELAPGVSEDEVRERTEPDFRTELSPLASHPVVQVYETAVEPALLEDLQIQP